jgi:hypothetical protein
VPILTFPRLVSEAALTDRKLYGLLRKRIVEPRIEIVAAAVEGGIERGELRADLDVQTAVDLFLGALTFLELRTGKGWDAEPGSVERIVDAMIVGLAT